MTDIKEKFGTSNQAVTITLASLANTSLRQSTVVDNGTNLFSQVFVGVNLTAASSGVSATGYVNVYAYATADGGSTYMGGASGSDAAYSADKTNLRFIGSMTMNANNQTPKGLFDIATGFGNVVPEKWGIVIENLSGAALAASGQSVFYQGELAQA